MSSIQQDPRSSYNDMEVNIRSLQNLSEFTAGALERPHYSKLCSKCRHVDWETVFKMSPDQAGGNGKPVIDLENLEKSSNNSRCDLCSLFAATSDIKPGLYPDEQSRSRKVRKFHVRAYNTSKVLKLSNNTSRASLQKSIALAVVPGKAFRNPSGVKKEFHKAITQGLIVPVPSNITLRPKGLEIWGRLILPTLLPGRYVEIKEWIDECEKLHEKCRRQERLRFPNFRLIDCGTREIVPMTAEMPYLALSYVCGKPSPILARQHNTRRARNALPSRISKTISDAMIVVRNLGYKYLWVDRHCIDQEDQNDRRRQIENMDQIYARAELVIIAADGEDANAGLPGVTTILRTDQPKALIGGSSVVSTLPHLSVFLAKSKWARRGWTFQEVLLARRSLFFTKAQVYFVCQKGTCCESMMQSSRAELLQSKPDPLTVLNPRLFEPTRRVNEGPILIDSSDYTLDIHSRISEYATRELTKDSDALNAFKGILARFACHSYWGILIPPSLDGAVEEQGLNADRGFAHGLIWYGKFSPKAAQSSSRRLAAPTWSWVSMNGNIDFSEGRLYSGSSAVTCYSKRLTVSGKIQHHAKFWVETRNEELLDLQSLVDRAKKGSRILPELSKFIHIESETTKIKLGSYSPNLGPEGVEAFVSNNHSSQRNLSLGYVHLDTSSDLRPLVNNDLHDLEAILLLDNDDQSTWMLVRWDGDSACRVGTVHSWCNYEEKNLERIYTQTKTIRVG